jgi:hypothetical protein
MRKLLHYVTKARFAAAHHNPRAPLSILSALLHATQRIRIQPLENAREKRQPITPNKTRLKNRKAIEKNSKLPTTATRRRQFFPAD